MSVGGTCQVFQHRQTHVEDMKGPGMCRELRSVEVPGVRRE